MASDSDELKDPLLALREGAQYADIELLAQSLDPARLAAVYRELGYNAEKRARTLVRIVEDGTPAQQMRAMEMLAEMERECLANAGILVKPAQGLQTGLLSDPVGAPKTRTIEAEVTTKRVRETIEMGSRELRPERTRQPLLEPNHVQEEQADTDYFADERGTNANIFRPATADHGQRTEIG